LLLLVVPFQSAGLKVQADKQNVVASRLEGDWVPDPKVNARLKGNLQGIEALSFQSDPVVAGKIPAQYKKFLGAKRIYMAGKARIGDKEYPFLLIEHSGNPHLVFFRERDGNPMGDAESSNVMLAPARDRVNDLLLVGADFNNEPFRAFQRKERVSAR